MAAMSPAYYAPILVAVLANVLYHVSQKLTPAAAPPLLTIGLSFATASALALAGFALTGRLGWTEGVRSLSWTTAGLGVAVVVIETSFLIAYRKGWPVGITGLVVVAGQTALLIPVGRLFFTERLPFAAWLGAALCAAGLTLIALAPRFG